MKQQFISFIIVFVIGFVCSSNLFAAGDVQQGKEKYKVCVACHGDNGDSFIGLTGKVDVKNLESGQVVQLEPNTTVHSSLDGSLTVIPTKPLELYVLEQMEDEAGEVTEEEINNFNSPTQSPTLQTQPTTNPSNSGQSAPVEHELKIKLINASGDEKELIIKYSE